jgi:hypothetical protein
MVVIDASTDSCAEEIGQQEGAVGLSQHNPSPIAEIVRRGQQAMERKRRDYDDWLLIAEALQVGRAEVMRAAHTNEPKGKRYEKGMAEWLRAHSFDEIDKGTRERLLECLQHGKEIEIWRARLTKTERFRFNHPDTILRKWKAATGVPDPNAPRKPSPVSKLKVSIAQLQEDNFRMRREIEHAGGDLWTPEDAAEDIATVMLAKLSPTKAERIARTILQRLKKPAPCKPAASQTGAEIGVRHDRHS